MAKIHLVIPQVDCIIKSEARTSETSLGDSVEKAQSRFVLSLANSLRSGWQFFSIVPSCKESVRHHSHVVHWSFISIKGLNGSRIHKHGIQVVVKATGYPRCVDLSNQLVLRWHSFGQHHFNSFQDQPVHLSETVTELNASRFAAGRLIAHSWLFFTCDSLCN